MVATQEAESLVQEKQDPTLLDMAEMLAQIADKLLSTALVMAVLAEKEVPKGSLIEKLLDANTLAEVTSGLQQTTYTGGTTGVPYQPAPYLPTPAQPKRGKWQRNKLPGTAGGPWPTITTNTTITNTAGIGTNWQPAGQNKWQSLTFNQGAFEKAVADFVNQSMSSAGISWGTGQ